MKVASLQGVSNSAKGVVTPVIDVEAVSSSFTMCSEGELVASPEGLRPVKTSWRQAEDCAKDEYQVSPSAPLLTTSLDTENGWVCGCNADGQLGVGVNGNVAEPRPLGSGRWAALSFGSSHAAGVSSDGEVYAWGRNDYAQLGHVALQLQPLPMRLPVLKGIDVRAIACGRAHTVALTGEEVITWGCNEEGQCGQGERAEMTTVKPRFIRMLSQSLVTQVVCGSDHTLCVTATSQVFAWGRNVEGQLGLGDTKGRRMPTPVDALWALPVQQLAAGERHSAALTGSGFLFTWGSNTCGQLGLPAGAEVAAQNQMARSDSERAKVRRVANQRFLSAMLDMGFAQDHAELALAETGNVGVEVATEWLFSCPDDVLDHHLHGTAPGSPAVSHAEEPDFILEPRRVVLQGVRWVAAGGSHTVAVTESAVHSWGDNGSGQLGLGHFKEQHQPMEILSLKSQNVISVACGALHTLFLCVDGTVFGCGDASAGQLPCSKHELAPAHTSSPGGASDGSPQGLQRSRLVSPVPRHLRLPFLNARAPMRRRPMVVGSLIAGGHGSAFLTRGADELPDPKPPQLLERLQNAIDVAAMGQAAAADVAQSGGALVGRGMACEQQLDSVVVAVEMIFGSAAAIVAAFGRKDTVGVVDAIRLDAVQQALLSLYGPPPGISTHGPDAAAVYFATRRQSVRDALGAAMERLLVDLNNHVKLLGTPERVQVLLAAAQTPLLSDLYWGPRLVPQLCIVILRLSSQARQFLLLGWSEYDPALLANRVVGPLQAFLTTQLQVTKKLTTHVMSAIKALAVVDQANQLGRVLPPEAFYNALISDKLDVDDHYIAWRQTHDAPGTEYESGDGPFSFCSYPFLLNPRAKSKLLHTEARIMMNHTVQQARVEQLHSPIRNRRLLPEDRVLPTSASKIRLRNASVAQAAADDQIRERRESRRTGRPTAVRVLWNNLWRGSADGSAAEAQPTAQQLAESGHETRPFHDDSMREFIQPAPEAVPEAPRSGGLVRQGSMNLPSPEECGVPAEHPDMCILRIRRHHLIEDALDEIARQRPKDLFKPLRVHFIGEDGIDAGGVKKEFFQLLVAELLCPDYGMLIQNPESRTFWFNPSTLEAETEFMLVGLVLGLAIYNSVLLDFPLPIALYKKLVGQQLSLRDLSEMEPTLGKSLRELLNYSGEGSVEDVFCQTFTAGMPGIGEVRSVALAPGGEDIFVTEANRREYVEAYVDFYLTRSVHYQFEAFARGFAMLCAGPALHLFSATELERLVCGNPNLDFAAFQKSARYEGGFFADHPVVKWLWQIVNKLEADDQRRFLKFFTGSDRAPIGGLGNLRCTIQRDGPDSNKLPTSHTCFNTLLLPAYSNMVKLEERLRVAIDWSAQGFGLE